MSTNYPEWKTSETYITRESLARDILLILVKNYSTRFPALDENVQEQFIKSSFDLADKFVDKTGDISDDLDDEEHNAHE
jgi:hypothetical protein